MSAAHEEVLYSDISEKTLHVGDVITLCVQREGKIFCVGSEGFVELGCSLRELDLARARAGGGVGADGARGQRARRGAAREDERGGWRAPVGKFSVSTVVRFLLAGRPAVHTCIHGGVAEIELSEHKLRS